MPILKFRTSLSGSDAPSEQDCGNYESERKKKHALASK